MEDRIQMMSLADEEDEGLVLEDVVNNQQPLISYDLYVVGRFLTDRHIRFPIMKDRMASLWRAGRGVAIKEFGSQMFLFQFFHELDLKRVLEGSPWTFDNHLLILHKLGPEEVPS
ncbi:hypothetical protein PTKIN_Ptkin16aG0485400 [Pterospermum kingtungense]